MVVTGKKLGLALCEALDLDPASEITSIVVMAIVGEPARVQVERLVTGDQLRKIEEALTSYALVDQRGTRDADDAASTSPARDADAGAG